MGYILRLITIVRLLMLSSMGPKGRREGGWATHTRRWKADRLSSLARNSHPDASSPSSVRFVVSYRRFRVRRCGEGGVGHMGFVVPVLRSDTGRSRGWGERGFLRQIYLWVRVGHEDQFPDHSLPRSCSRARQAHSTTAGSQPLLPS